MRKIRLEDLLGKDIASKILDESFSLIKRKQSVLRESNIVIKNIRYKRKYNILIMLKKIRKKSRTKQELEQIGCEFYEHKGKQYAMYTNPLLDDVYYWRLKGNLYFND